MYLSQDGENVIRGKSEILRVLNEAKDKQSLYRLVRHHLTIPELLKFYTKDEIFRYEFGITINESLEEYIKSTWK